MQRRLEGREVAVLASGGIESAVLCIDLLNRFERVAPIYVRFGLRWEQTELASLRRYLDAAARPGLEPLTVLDEPVASIYGEHWSLGGRDVPAADSADEAVYLPGRNILLLVKAALWCRLRGVDSLAIGSLATNPFPDSTPSFYDRLEAALETGLAGPVKILRPFAGLHKSDVLTRGEGLPLSLTMSCIAPVGGVHCGGCNKCAERARGFAEVGRADDTIYARQTVNTL